MVKNVQIAPEIVQIALESLKSSTDWKMRWKKSKEMELDGILEIHLAGKPLTFFVEVKREFRNHHLPAILALADRYKGLMVVGHRILPGVKEALRQHHIAYLEGNGNIFVDRKPVYIWIDNHKPVVLQPKKINRAFSRAGLQVVFLFLAQPDYVNKPYRAIAQAAGVALGNIKYVMEGLMELGFLLKEDSHTYMLNNQSALLDKWGTAYEEKLKPALFVGNYRFLHTESTYAWKDIGFNTQESVWGGEPGGDLLTNYLRPEIFTLYSTMANKALMKTFRIVPDQAGPIRVYKKFWEDLPEKVAQAAPPLLIYADLINTHDKRCVETAQLVYERYIHLSV